jgi:hypothetical protein
MADTLSQRQAEAPLSTARERWEEPAILLERSLGDAAGRVPPGDRRGARSDGFLGPLSTAGGSGLCSRARLAGPRAFRSPGI